MKIDIDEIIDRYYKEYKQLEANKPMRTCPSSIEVIMHFYYSPEPHPRRNAPAVIAAIRDFLNEGLIVQSLWDKNLYSCTERGRMWVEMICATPYPQQVYVDPRDGKTVV